MSTSSSQTTATHIVPAEHTEISKLSGPASAASDHVDAPDRLIDIAAGESCGAVASQEQRTNKRYPYVGLVGLILFSETGHKEEPMVLRARDICATGVGMVSRKFIHAGTKGALQLVRSCGRSALIGVQVSYCNYVGEMRHEMGVEFGQLPIGVTPDDFLDDDGRMPLFDPLLAENVRR